MSRLLKNSNHERIYEASPFRVGLYLLSEQTFIENLWPPGPVVRMLL